MTAFNNSASVDKHTGICFTAVFDCNMFLIDVDCSTVYGDHCGAHVQNSFTSHICHCGQPDILLDPEINFDY